MKKTPNGINLNGELCLRLREHLLVDLAHIVISYITPTVGYKSLSAFKENPHVEDIVLFDDVKTGSERKDAYNYLTERKIPFMTVIMYEVVRVCKKHKKILETDYDKYLTDCVTGRFTFYRSLTDCNYLQHHLKRIPVRRVAVCYDELFKSLSEANLIGNLKRMRTKLPPAIDIINEVKREVKSKHQ